MRNEDANKFDTEEVSVVQYVRMSTEHQKYSTENQGAAIAEYAAHRNMRIIRTYADSGKSGLNLKGRSGLQQLLRDVQQPKPDFSAVLVYDISRWGRFPDPDEAAVYEYMCKSRGIRVIYCAEPFNNDGSMPSTVFIGIKRSMAAEYSRELSVKVFAGQRNLVQRGYRQGGRPGFGLRRQLISEHHEVKGFLSRGEQKSIQTDRVILVPGPPEEVATVHRIYRHFLEDGMPERVIASVLNRDGIHFEIGTLWTRDSVHQVLTNEKYIGNNVFNRTSFKLKIKHQRNTPGAWIRKDGAFEAIVPIHQFRQVQAIIGRRSGHLDDAQMLDLLKQTLEKHGALSESVINEDDDVPSSGTYRSRFGSLLRAYKLVGYQPTRDYTYLEVNQSLRKQRPELLEEITERIRRSGGWTQCDPSTDLLTINGEFTASLVIARYKSTPSGMCGWRLRLNTSLRPDITVVARMDQFNRCAFDYYVLPAIDFLADALPTLVDNGFVLDSYRTSSLELFYQLAGRLPLEEIV
ncbi:recombinase family protein [Polaromonas sp. JS666]|uniref:recombinase family protein n=1 Tax=Polaromonas sp. (strain JS666 / ATCC BAA-500) TaxID=296591 RepID=UPI00210F57A4|nr:recombinase family protein [Polaromonas sp. JS666]